MSKTRCIAAAIVVATIAPQAARADDVRPITIVSPGERSTNTKLILAGIAGAGLLAGASGLYFHLDSRSKSDEIGTQKFTGKAWSPALQAIADDANSSRTAAIVGYSLGGALLIGAAVYWIVTDPPDETIVIHPTSAQPAVVPVPGGAVLGGTWSF